MAREPNIEKIIQKYASRLSRLIHVDSIILTGSRARGDELKTSDIDLLVVSPDLEGMDTGQRLQLLAKAWKEEKIGLTVEAIGYTKKEIKKMQKTSLYVKDALRYGKVISLHARKGSRVSARPRSHKPSLRLQALL